MLYDKKNLLKIHRNKYIEYGKDWKVYGEQSIFIANMNNEITNLISENKNKFYNGELINSKLLVDKSNKLHELYEIQNKLKKKLDSLKNHFSNIPLTEDDIFYDYYKVTYNYPKVRRKSKMKMFN